MARIAQIESFNYGDFGNSRYVDFGDSRFTSVFDFTSSRIFARWARTRRLVMAWRDLSPFLADMFLLLR
jgi:hypothetical protein